MSHESFAHSPQASQASDFSTLVREVAELVDRSMWLSASPVYTERIRGIVRRAVSEWDIVHLEHIRERLRAEKRFLLEHLRSLIHHPEGELSAIKMRFHLQKAYTKQFIAPAPSEKPPDIPEYL